MRPGHINLNRAEKNLPEIRFTIGPVDDFVWNPQRNQRLFFMGNERVKFIGGVIIHGKKVQ